VTQKENIKFFPRITQVVEAGMIGKSCIEVMEAAPGTSVSKIFAQWASDQDHSKLDPSIPQKIGRSLGSFHYLLASNKNNSFTNLKTWLHGDLHHNNFFLDPQTEQITFIDTPHLGPKKSSPIPDLNKFFLEALENGFSDFSHDADYVALKYFRKSSKPNDQKNLLISYLDMMNSNDWQNHDGPGKDGFLKSQKILSGALEFNVAFAAGYLNSFPEHFHKEIKDYFIEKCESLFENFLSTLKPISQDVKTIDPELKNKLRIQLESQFPCFSKCLHLK
jgi:hypothetical protein